ncbi:hypothetical protein ABI59_00700 [Acidobacteria bacterium Mor1]|nr:hypothetical protein ABI59_00700 [Acidobacteria bacterium Mor1]
MGLVLLALIVCAGCSVDRNTNRLLSQPGADPAESATEPAEAVAPAAPADPSGPALPLDPAVTMGKLDNGLTYYLRPNGKPEDRVDLWLAVNAGSIQEDEDQQGLAHFLEHMAFNGTENFEKQELVDFLEKIGMRFGPDVNAYTSFDETVYMLELPTDDPEILDTAWLILHDWASGVTFDPEEVDKERGVVLEEWRLGRGAAARIQDKQFPMLFHGSRYAERLPIGKTEILKEAPASALERFYRDWYRPDLMAIIAVGDLDPAEMEKTIKARFSDLKNPRKPRPREEYPVPGHAETLVSIETDPEMTNTQVQVVTKGPRKSSDSRESYRSSLVEGLYASMFNARLDELRQQADPPFLFAGAGAASFSRSSEFYFQVAAVEEGGVERGLETLLVEAERVTRHGFTTGELERTKKQLLRGFEQAYRERDKQRSQRFANEILRHFLEQESMPGIAVELEMVREFLPTITLDEVNTLSRELISDENRVIAVSGPEKDGLVWPSKGDLLAVFDNARKRQIAAYEDKVKDQPLVSNPPQGGTVVSRDRIDELGVTVWGLSNGVQVVLKPTDFNNDQILIAGSSPGGTSLVDDAAYTSASYAGSLAGVGGLGEFSQVELEKALAGKVAGARAYLGELEEGVRGSASPQDFVTMLQLVYLNITAPRRDDEAIRAWMSRMHSSLVNRDARPETVFGDKYGEVLSQGHLRRKPPTVETLEQIDVERAFAIYRDRFKDAGDFVFTLVGNFDPAEIEAPVAKWLGGLPAAGRKEQWRDVGVSTPKGVVDFEVRKGLEPKSSVRITFNGDAEYSFKESHGLRSLAEAMQIRLREILREDMGGTYGVSVRGSISRRPQQRYSVTVSFGCAPENVEAMTRAVFAEVDRMRTEGVGQEYVDKVKEAQIRGRETQLKENGFWLGNLDYYYTYGDDPRWILKYDELVQSVTAERMKQMALRYLDKENYVQGVLYPEEAGDAVASGGSGN